MRLAPKRHLCAKLIHLVNPFGKPQSPEESLLVPTTAALTGCDDTSGAEDSQSSAGRLRCVNPPNGRSYKIVLILHILFNSFTRTTTSMIISNEHQAPSSSYDDGDNDQTTPPPYQERVPPSQLLPSERPTTSVYAPSVSGSEPPREREKELPPHPGFPDEKARGKEREGESPTQRLFSSMIWTSSAPTSPNPASTSRISTVQVHDPLNPPPAAFTRPTPKHYAYLPFQPMTMLGISEKLVDGFPMIPPPVNSEDETSAGKANAQHPFVSHDITEEDWLK